MAKKPKSDNFDALGSVFDFLFTEARKPPDKRKPIKPTGISGNNMMTNAVFAALEKPGAFISDTVVDEFNSALDYELAVIKVDEFGKVKLTSNSIIDVLKDPQKAVEKSIAKSKAIRKSQRALFLGAEMTDFITAGWARKYANLEAQKAIYGTTIAREIKIEQEKQRQLISKAMGQAATTHGEKAGIIGKNETVPGIFSPNDLDFMAKRSATIIAKKTFGERVWNTMNTNDQREFLRALSSTANTDFARGEEYEQNLGGVKTYLTTRYGAGATTYINNFTRVLGRDALGNNIKPEKTGLYKASLYMNLEKANIDDRIAELQNLGVRTREQDKELQIYTKTKYLIDRDTANLRNELIQLKRRLSTTTDRETRKQIQKEMRDARSAISLINGNNFIGQIGRFEGYINSINAVHGANMIPSILNGSFYNKNINTFFRPSTESALQVHSGTFKGATELEILVPAKSGGVTKANKLIDAYNDLGTNLYYFTPLSVFRTIFYNGEGFAYLMTKQLNLLDSKGYQDIMRQLTTVGIDKGSISGIFANNNGINLEGHVENILHSARGLLSPQDLEKLSKTLNATKVYKNLTSNFSMPFQIQSYINKIFAEKFKRQRVRFARFLMSKTSIRNLLVKTGASRLLGNWIAGGGIKALAQTFVTAIAGAIGIIGTPLASAIIGAVTWLVTDFAMKVIAQMMIIGKYMLFGLIGLIVLIFFWASESVKSFNKTNISYYNETPGSIIQCSLYEERDLGKDDDAPWGDTIIPPPSGESCILGAGSFGCSQGYKETRGWSHQSIPHLMPVDLTSVGYIYAPQFCSTGNCSITRIAVINCRDGSNAGGIVELTASNGSTTYLFKLLHVKPLAGLGEKLSGGQPVAVVQDTPEVERGWCWTGKHLHLETRQNGAIVDPLELLQRFSCNVPDESGCARP